ncbi:MAG: hypothetical protein JWO31_2813 [Phycisphaerales bacterium]|nr:hypothetical protein [Phycisphaerales bacterium]
MGWRRGMANTALATAAYAGVHSLLATRAAKDWAERQVGTRRRNAFYRPAYNAVAVAGLVGLVGYVAAQPSRTLYRARGPAAALMRVGQAAALAGFVATVWRTGPLRFAGVPGLLAWVRGDRHVPREPEGQSPPIEDLRPVGTYGLVRHPANLLPVPLLWLAPRMTSVLAAFNVVATAYFYVGSQLSDRRLRARHGHMYDRYRQSGVPLFIPRVRGRTGAGV